MEALALFSAVLKLEQPWQIDRIDYKGEEPKEELHIYLSHTRRTKFEYDGDSYSVYDHQDRTWRHLDFFQSPCYLHARVPRIKHKDGMVKLVRVPWAQAGSSFTLLFENLLLALVSFGLSMTKAGEATNIGRRRVFGLVQRRVSNALATQGLDTVKELSIDETSSKRGHQYLTILTDREARKVVGIAPGKDVEAVAQSLADAEVRGASKEDVKCIAMDMSKAFIAAATEHMPQADIVFDRFHITKKLNEHVDEIRRQEQKEAKDLKRTRYLWLKNNKDLTKKQKESIQYLEEAYPNLGQAYRLKELFKDVMDGAYKNSRLKPLNDWIKLAWNSGIHQMQKFVNFLHNHWYGIKTYFKKLATNALAESVNLKIQEIKRIAKGYRNIRNFITVIYFHLGGLDLFKPIE
jgi:transposase